MSSLEHHPTELPLPAQQLRFAVWPSPLLLHTANLFALPFNQQQRLSMLLQLFFPPPNSCPGHFPKQENMEQLWGKAKTVDAFLCAFSILNHTVPVCVYTVEKKHSEWQSWGSENRQANSQMSLLVSPAWHTWPFSSTATKNSSKNPTA